MNERPSAFLGRAALAAELDIAESTVDEMMRRGVLPQPYELSGGCVRWKWIEVEEALACRKRGGNNPPADPFLAGASNVTKIAEKRRGPA